MKVRWGILSTARINQALLAGVRACADAEVVAVASRDGEAAERYARAHGIERAHAGYEALLRDPEVDVVYVSLPNALHVEWSRRALQAGKHVLCEKPLSRRADEVRELFATAERADRLITEAFMYRHHPQTRRLCELVEEGAVGPLRLIRAAFSFPLGDTGDVRLQRSLDGGALMDVGCYCVNAIRLLGGEPQHVQGEQVLGGDGVDVAFSGLLRLRDDVLGQFDCGMSYAARSALEVVGAEGVLRLADPWHGGHAAIELSRGHQREDVEVSDGDAYRLEVQDLSRAIADGGSPLLGREDAVGQARVIEALYRSAQEARTVTL